MEVEMATAMKKFMISVEYLYQNWLTLGLLSWQVIYTSKRLAR